MDTDASNVPAKVTDGLQRCRNTGTVDLHDVTAVLRWLRDGGLYFAADWVELNPHRYESALKQIGPISEA